MSRRPTAARGRRARAPQARDKGVSAVPGIVQRITGRLDELGGKFGNRYSQEIVDYLTLDDEILYGDVVVVSLENLKALLDNLESGEIVGPDELEKFRESAVRRVHQGVSLESLLHAYRLWGQIVWETILESTRVDRREEREAGLRIAGRVIEHINLVSTAVAQAYLDEAQGVWSDREVVRRDLLEALLSGKADSDDVRAQADSLHLDLGENYFAVLAGRSGAVDRANDGGASPRAEMRGAVDLVKLHLRPRARSLLVGLRHDEVVALYPADTPKCIDVLREQCAALAAAVENAGFSVGMGGWHPGARGVASTYAEAREALDIALRKGVRGHPVVFDDVIVGHVLRSNPKSERLLTDALKALYEYDGAHGTDLVATLKTFVDARFNITKSAAMLCVHPNTVVYRLKRVKELTGRDASDPNDVLLLSLALKLAELEA